MDWGSIPGIGSGAFGERVGDPSCFHLIIGDHGPDLGIAGFCKYSVLCHDFQLFR